MDGLKGLFKNEKRVILVLLVASILVYGFLYNSFDAFGSDEAFYLNNAQKIYEGGGYQGGSVAPGYSFIIAGFYHLFGMSDDVAKLVNPIFAVISIILVYFISREFFDVKTSFLSAFLFALLPAFMILGERVLTEVPFITFFLLSIFFFIRGFRKDPRYFILAGIFTIIAFAIRYQAVFLLAIYTIYFLTDLKTSKKIFRNKYIYIGFLAMVFAATPLFLYSLQLYQNPIELFFESSESYNITPEEPQTFYLVNFLVIPAALLPFLVYTAYFGLKAKNKILTWFIFSIVFLVLYKFLFFTVRETRYLIDIAPFVAILSALGYMKLKEYLKGISKSLLNILLVIVVLVNLVGGVYIIDQFANNARYIEIRDASLWASENCGGELLTNSGRHVEHYTQKTPLPININELSSYSDFCIIYSPYEGVMKEVEENLNLLGELRSFGKVSVVSKSG